MAASALLPAMETLTVADAEPYLPDASEGEESDVATAVLSRYHSSPREDHQHLCASVGAMAQALKDQSIPPTPVAYFAATAASLDRLSKDPNAASDPVTAALLAFLSILLPSVAPAVVRSKGAAVSEALLRVLGFAGLPVWGVKAGLKCAAQLIVVGEKESWSKVAPLYGVVLGFATDQREKVRKQAHSCLHDILHSLQGSTMWASASEGITNIFERFLLLAGGYNSSTSAAVEGSKGAVEVLYILNALKDCLPLMSLKYTNNILKYCKSLLNLQQPIVTRNVMDILQAVCCSSTSEVASALLLDLLCSLALSIGEMEKSADDMASTARLLHAGTIKVYNLSRQICTVKLPTIFSALGGILASEFEEAIHAATEALKGLIYSCIDECLIKEGVEQINLSHKGGIRKSGPTIIEKICAIFEGLLGYQYNAVLDRSFQVFSTAFYQLGESSSCLMVGTIRSLADLQKLPDEDFSYRKQLHECIGSALRAMGPETFLSLLPLKLEAEDVSDVNVWLLPILKQYTIGARLQFFLEYILHMADLLQKKSIKLEKERGIYSARAAEGLVYSLWSLLPAFCNYPVDTSSSFAALQKHLRRTICQKPDLHGIICSSLQILIQQNKSVLGEHSVMPDEELSNPERKAKEYYTPKVAEANLNTIRLFSRKFLSVLSDTFRSSKDSGGCLQSTIRDFALISEKNVVSYFFKKLMIELSEVNKAEQPENSIPMQVDGLSKDESLPRDRRALLLDLAVSLLPGLSIEEIGVLFIPIASAIQDEEGLMQKKAYKALSLILKDRDEFLGFKLDELLKLMITATDSCHFSAKRHRLDCLYFLIVYISKDTSEQRKRECISAFLTEIVLALKETNKKTRNRAYELLVKIGHACGDEEQGGNKENLHQFFYMIAGGVAGEKPHMISAAVKGLARLAYEFSDLMNAAYSLLPSSFLLMQRKNREIIKANLGLLKVLVAKSKADGLQVHLRAMVEGLLKWQDDKKNHFKAKVKLLIEMLVRKCGLDAVRAVMPEEHMKLLTNIRKINERKVRKAKSEDDMESVHSKTNASRQSRWNHTRIFSDFGDEDGDNDSDAEYMGAKTVSGRRSKASLPFSRASLRSVRKRQAAKSLSEDLLGQLGDDPLDLLDRQRTRSALQSSTHLKRKPESSEEPEIDLDGRLVVREDGIRAKETKSFSMDHKSETRSQMDSQGSAKSSSRTQKKRQKTSNSGWAYTGHEYASRKASGDVKKKDKLDPYAYWPLDRKLLNRREEHKAVARKGMARVMKFTKKLEGKSASGALAVKGLKIKKKQRDGKKKLMR